LYLSINYLIPSLALTISAVNLTADVFIIDDSPSYELPRTLPLDVLPLPLNYNTHYSTLSYTGWVILHISANNLILSYTLRVNKSGLSSTIAYNTLIVSLPGSAVLSDWNIV